MTLDVLREATRLAERGERVGLATIIATRGSTPQKVGARLLARDGQRLAGTLGGGAVEAETIGEATSAAAGGPPVVREYDLSTGVDDWGLACGGTMIVFVERLDERALAWLRPVVEATEGRDPIAVVTVVEGEASGARLLVREGEVAGSLPDAPLTAAATELGRRVLAQEASELDAAAGVRLYAEPVQRPACADHRRCRARGEGPCWPGAWSRRLGDRRRRSPGVREPRAIPGGRPGGRRARR